MSEASTLTIDGEQRATIEDALTTLWWKTPSRRREIEALCLSTGLYLEGEGDDEYDEGVA